MIDLYRDSNVVKGVQTTDQKDASEWCIEIIKALNRWIEY